MNRDLLATIDSAIAMIQTKLTSNEGAKASIADLVRLLQLRKELEGEMPRQITVRWIERKEEGDECKTSTD